MSEIIESCKNCRHETRSCGEERDRACLSNNFSKFKPNYPTLESQLAKANETIKGLIEKIKQ